MAADPESLRDVLSEKELTWLAGDLAFKAGQQLFLWQRVEFTRAGTRNLHAIVTESDSFEVDIHLQSNGDISYSCNCSTGRMELFCSHAVAAALTWLSEKYDATDLWSDAVAAMNESDEAEDMNRQLLVGLQQMDRDELIEIVLEWAQRDPGYAQNILNSQRFAYLFQSS